MKISFQSVLKNFWFTAKLTGTAILLAICLRVFVFASFKIPSPSMEPAISPGDFIYVNKLALGGRIYKNFKFREGGKVEVCRAPGFCQVKRNDVLVFNFPYSDWNKLDFDLNVFYVKRCVAIPGDTFYIDNGIYKVKNCLDTLGCYENQRQFAKAPEQDIDPGIWNCFPYNEAYPWNIRNFGPLYIPKKGDKLAIDSRNICLYRNIIQYETDRNIRIENDLVYLNNEVLKQYTFQKNYYFMTGDFVFDSKDSRYWGLLPEEHIVGKAAIIWKSENMETGKYRWERVFKRIRN